MVHAGHARARLRRARRGPPRRARNRRHGQHRPGGRRRSSGRGIACAPCGREGTECARAGVVRPRPQRAVAAEPVAARRNAAGRRLDLARRARRRVPARPSARSRSSQPVDARALHFERADYDVQPYEDALGKGRRLTLVSSRAAPRRVAAPRGRPVRRAPVLRDARRRHEPGREPLPLAVAARRSRRRTKAAAGCSSRRRRRDWRIYRNGWQSWAPTMSFGGAERDVRSAPPELSPEPPQSEPGRFASDDVGVLYDPVVRAVAARGRDDGARLHHAGATSMRPRSAIDARCLADGIAVAPGRDALVRALPRRRQRPPERPARALRRRAGARDGRARADRRRPRAGAPGTTSTRSVTEDDVVRNLRFLEQHRRELPIDTVQIDDGYQADIGDWLTVEREVPARHAVAGVGDQARRLHARPLAGAVPARRIVADVRRASRTGSMRDDDGAPVIANAQLGARATTASTASHPDAQRWLDGALPRRSATAGATTT